VAAVLVAMAAVGMLAPQVPVVATEAMEICGRTVEDLIRANLMAHLVAVAAPMEALEEAVASQAAELAAGLMRVCLVVAVRITQGQTRAIALVKLVKTSLAVYLFRSYRSIYMSIKIAANPYALLKGGIVESVVYMQDQNATEIEQTLAKHSYDEAVSCSDYGEILHVGYVKIQDWIVLPCPEPSFVFDASVGHWVPPEGYEYPEAYICTPCEKDSAEQKNRLSDDFYSEALSGKNIFKSIDLVPTLINEGKRVENAN
jgi:hypothetical protein